MYHKYQTRAYSGVTQHFHVTWHPKPELSTALPGAKGKAPCRTRSTATPYNTDIRLQVQSSLKSTEKLKLTE